MIKKSRFQKNCIIVISHFSSKYEKNHKIFHNNGTIKYQIIDISQISIINGIVHAINTFEIGESIETCQKSKIIMGRVKHIAERVKIKLSLIEKKSGNFFKILLNKSFV